MKDFGTILTNSSASDRNSTDFYPTPDNCVEALLNVLNLPTDRIIWEPACGEGHISKFLKNKGYNTIDTTLHDQGYGNVGLDFLTQSGQGDVIITNPPFKLAEEFIEHAIDLNMPFAFLLKSQFWHSKRRMSLFDKHKPKYVLPLTWRPDFLFGKKSGSSTMECLWTVWGSKPADNTIYQPLSKPK